MQNTKRNQTDLLVVARLKLTKCKKFKENFFEVLVRNLPCLELERIFYNPHLMRRNRWKGDLIFAWEMSTLFWMTKTAYCYFFMLFHLLKFEEIYFLFTNSDAWGRDIRKFSPLSLSKHGLLLLQVCMIYILYLYIMYYIPI